MTPEQQAGIEVKGWKQLVEDSTKKEVLSLLDTLLTSLVELPEKEDNDKLRKKRNRIIKKWLKA